MIEITTFSEKNYFTKYEVQKNWLLFHLLISCHWLYYYFFFHALTNFSCADEVIIVKLIVLKYTVKIWDFPNVRLSIMFNLFLISLYNFLFTFCTIYYNIVLSINDTKYIFYHCHYLFSVFELYYFINYFFISTILVWQV